VCLAPFCDGVEPLTFVAREGDVHIASRNHSQVCRFNHSYGFIVKAQHKEALSPGRGNGSVVYGAYSVRRLDVAVFWPRKTASTKVLRRLVFG
jgi:hypothetical protein